MTIQVKIISSGISRKEKRTEDLESEQRVALRSLPDRKRSSRELVGRSLCCRGAATTLCEGPGVRGSACRGGSTPATHFIATSV